MKAKTAAEDLGPQPRGVVSPAGQPLPHRTPERRAEDTRITGAILLIVAATLIGLVAVGMLGASGLTAAGSGLAVTPLSDSDDAERTIAIAIGVAGLAVWLGALVSAAILGLRGARPARARRITVGILLGLGTAVVLTGLIATLAAR